jgi:phosphatidylglycerophosphatase B
LVGIVFLFDLSFTACLPDSIVCSVAFWLTESAGKYGTFTIIIAVGIFYAWPQHRWLNKVWVFTRSVITLVLFLTFFAWINEYVTKPYLKSSRPSHTYIIKNANATAKLDSLYLLKVEQRQLFFKNLLDRDSIHFKNIDSRVLTHWVDEAGYSFPSGHSFNAFLLAGIVAFSFYQVRNNKLRILYFLPYVWALAVAVSRVAIGAHTALDVSAGAALGILVSHMLIWLNPTQRLIIYKRPES